MGDSIVHIVSTGRSTEGLMQANNPSYRENELTFEGDSVQRCCSHVYCVRRKAKFYGTML